MPFTPIHFGPGLLLKALAPKKFSFTAFALANVLVDLEPLYHIVRGDLPLHGPLHTLLAATTAGAIAGAGVSVLPKASKAVLKARDPLTTLPLSFRAELHTSACMLGGLIGGFSHSIIDSFMYSDFHPLAPFSALNPLLGLVNADTLVTWLLVAGLAGLALLLIRLAAMSRNRRAG
jgi:hypothetical protein